MKPALLFYCQHSVGLGHLMRSYALAEALAQQIPRDLLAGGELPEGIDPPRDVELVALPPLGVKPGGGLGSGDPRYTTERASAVRSERSPQRSAPLAHRSCSSSCSRSGARSSPASSIPLLEQARPLGAFTACSLRDILVSMRATSASTTTARPRSPTRTSTPCSCTPTRASPGSRRTSPSSRCACPSTTRASSPATATAPARRGEHIVVSAGGGRVGAPLLSGDAAGRAARCTRSAARDAARGLRAPQDASRTTSARPLRPDLAQQLRSAKASISQCRYNTTLDLLRRGSPRSSSLTPRPRRTSRPPRAPAAEDLGAVRMARASTATWTSCWTSRPPPPRSTSTAPPRPRAPPWSRTKGAHPRVLGAMARAARRERRAPGASPPPS